MNFIARGGALASFLAGCLVIGAAQAALPEFTELVKQNSPAVVNISTTQKTARGPSMELPDIPEGHPFGELFKRFFDEEGRPPEERDSESLGSGFIISEDGYVLSNHHVVEGADEVLVRLSDRRVLKAEVIGSDPQSDIALLKVDAKDLPIVRIGSSKALQVGEWVLAIGSPFGFEQSATAGIVSAKGRSLPRENYVPFIQTDVAINPGNSGGPLFDMEGRVIGINSQIYSRTGGYMGLSFAIPIEMAMNVADQLKTVGRVSRGWLGVLIQEIDRDLAESFGMEKPHGALVAKIFPGSPAGAGGVKVGDVIVQFAGQPVSTSSSLPPIVGSTQVGESVDVGVLRDGERLTLKVTVGELPDDAMASAVPVEETKSSALGLTVEDLDDEVRTTLDIDHGVWVSQVEDGTPADQAGIRQGDVIMMLGGKQVNDVADFNTLIEELPTGKSVPLLVQRGQGPVFLALKVAE
jgi:serine protease Do